MDTVLLFALPLVGGLIFCSTWNVTRYVVAREDGHRLYFRAVLFGSLLFAIVLLVRRYLPEWSPWLVGVEIDTKEVLKPLAKDKDAANAVGDLALTCFYAMILGWPLAFVLNRVPYVKLHCLKKAISKDDLESILYTAWGDNEPILFSMKDGKVYVGFVVSTFDPTTSRKTIGVLPLMSGYRQSETHKIVFTTYYLEIYGDGEGDTLPPPLEHLTPDDFVTILSVEDIASTRLFDLRAYEEFNKRGDNETPDVEPPDDDKTG